MYEINKENYPVPARPAKTRSWKYPFRKMKIGQSFDVPADDTNYKRIQINILGSARNNRFTGGEVYITRYIPEEGIIRVWRVK